MHSLAHYLRARWPLAVVLVYAAIGAALRLCGSINILPPCLWTALFHHHCPGCGITRAGLALLQGHVTEAWQTNPLVFPAVGIIIYAILTDYIKFCRNFAPENKRNASKEQQQ